MASISLKLTAMQAGIIAALSFPMGYLALNTMSDKITQLAERQLTEQANGAVLTLESTYKAMENSANISFSVFKSLMGPLTFSDEKMETAGKQLPQLQKMGDAINGDFTTADLFTKITSGSVATVFVKDGSDFFRISTSLKKEDGSRAFGTTLDHNHPAYQRMLDGKRYSGLAKLFGKQYMTVYEPIMNNNKVVGILFVGHEVSHELSELKERINTMKIGESGYFFALDKNVALAIHPRSEGKMVADSKDDSGVAYFKEMVDRKEGIINYTRADKEGEASRTKVAAFKQSPSFGWTVVASAYKNETLKDAGLTTEFYTISILSGLGAILLMTLLSASLIRRALAPVKIMSDRMTGLAKTGDLSGRLDVSDDELGDIARAFNIVAANAQSAIAEANNVLSKLSAGDFASRMDGSYSGDFEKLKQGINEAAMSLQSAMSGIERVMRSVQQGDFSARMTGVKAESVARSVDNAMQTLNATIADIVRVMHAMKEGDYSSSVTVDAKGQLAVLKDNINQSLSALKSGIEDVERTLRSNANGDLSARTSGSYSGDLRVLSEAVSSSASTLAVNIRTIAQAAQSVSLATDEVSAGSHELNQRTQEQVSAVDTALQATKDSVAQVDKVRDAISVAFDLASSQTQMLSDGGDVMNQAVETMSAIRASSEKMSEIVTLIDSIAFQTNLLALNAAVEAARAGEHGRGFAVVASEVRALAGKSAEAAKDIKTLIDGSVQQSREGDERVAQVGEVLNKISEATQRMKATVGSIAQATDVQADSTKRVSAAMNTVNKLAQHNASSVEELNHSANSMQEQSQLVLDEVSRFK